SSVWRPTDSGTQGPFWPSTPPRENGTFSAGGRDGAGGGRHGRRRSRRRGRTDTGLRDSGEDARAGPNAGARDQICTRKVTSERRRAVGETNRKIRAVLTLMRRVLFESRGRPRT